MAACRRNDFQHLQGCRIYASDQHEYVAVFGAPGPRGPTLSQTGPSSMWQRLAGVCSGSWAPRLRGPTLNKYTGPSLMWQAAEACCSAVGGRGRAQRPNPESNIQGCRSYASDQQKYVPPTTNRKLSQSGSHCHSIIAHVCALFVSKAKKPRNCRPILLQHFFGQTVILQKFSGQTIGQAIGH